MQGGLTLALQEDTANRFTGFWAREQHSLDHVAAKL
jgi:hypothetical protein